MALRQVGGNRSLLWLQAGWVTGLAAEGAYHVSLLVFAYEAGGLGAVGVVMLLRSLPAAVLGPLASLVADRFPRARVLVLAQVGRATLVGLVALAALADLPAAITLLAVALEGLLTIVHRAATHAIMPALSHAPEELVAANAVASLGEAIGGLLGPLAAGLLLVIGGPGVGLVAAACLHLVAAAVTIPIRVVGLRRVGEAVAESPASKLDEILGGFAALWRNPAAGLVAALFTSQTLVRGVLTVLLVPIVVERLAIGEAGVGYLAAALGAGGLAGAALAATLMGGGHVPRAFAFSLVGWGVPVAILGMVTEPVIAVLALAIVGASNAVLDVSGNTLLQRCVPNAVRGRAFGALESAAAIGLAAGAALAPPMVEAVGIAGTLVAVGLLLPLLAVITHPQLHRADTEAVVPQHELGLLRTVPMFTPLPLTSIEHLSQNLESVRHEAGERIIGQGDAGDAFFVIESGTVAVERDDRHVATLGPGDGFGEIALLTDRPRMASVVALEPVTAYRLPRGAFLEAVTGSPRAVVAAGDLVARRLAEVPEA